MTGFGAANGAVGRTQVNVEIRAVNHRFFNPTVRLPSAYSQWEGDVREALRRHITRGHVTAVVRVERNVTDTALAIDESRFAAYVQRLSALKDRYAIGGDIDLATVLRLPHVVAAPSVNGDDGGEQSS